MAIACSKLPSLLTATCLVLGTAVQAAAPNLYNAAQLVPYAKFTTTGELTAVGLLAHADGTVYWAFFDADGTRRAHNSFGILADHLHPFIWDATNAGGTTLAGEPGFLLFAIDTNADGQITDTDGNNGLGANAFYVLLGADVAYVPTVDLVDYQLTDPVPANWTLNPVALNPYTYPFSGLNVDIQYLIDGASGGDDTAIIIWTDRKMAASQGMTLNDKQGTSQAISTPLPKSNLNLIDLEADPEVTSAFFADGYLRWAIPNGADGSPVGVVLFSLISSPRFGAIQTLLPNVW